MTEAKISLQDIFNAAWQHFIVEDNPPASDLVQCKYLMEDGRKCAVGLVLPDGHPSQQGANMFSDLVFKYPELWERDILDMAKLDKKKLDRFQSNLHDDIQTDGGWDYSKDERKQVYIKTAEKYNLMVPNSSRSNEGGSCDL